MRLAVCALSAVLLSGCSWLGMGGQGSAGGAYGVNCAPSGTGFYNASGACGVGGGYGVAGYGNGYGAGGVYGAGYGTGAGYGAGAGFGTGAGYGAGYGTGYGAGYGTGAGFGAGTAGYGAGYGAGGFGAGQGFGAGYGAGTGFGTAGAGAGLVGAGLAANGVGGGFGTQGFGVNGFGGAYGANGAVTTLGTNAAFGSAVAGQNVVGTQFAGGQFVQGAGVQTIQGAPIYVPQPYPAYYGVPQLRGFGGAALPFGFELDGGTDFGIGGDVFTEKPAGPADEDESTGIRVSEIEAIGYDEAFGNSKSIGGTFGYDVSRSTTLLGRLGYSSAEGQTIDNYATVQEGSYSGGVHNPGTNPERAIDLTFSDLEQFSVEGGVRQYVGGGHAFRPYVGASAGFVHNNAVDIVQTYADGNAAPTGSVIYNEQEYISSGWSPTAAATLGAEVAVGPRAAIGVESGIRWSDKLDTNLDSESRWSVPLKLRGRVAF